MYVCMYDICMSFLTFLCSDVIFPLLDKCRLASVWQVIQASTGMPVHVCSYSSHVTSFIRKRPNCGLAMFLMCVVLLSDCCAGMCVVYRACPSMSAQTMGMLILL